VIDDVNVIFTIVALNNVGSKTGFGEMLLIVVNQKLRASRQAREGVHSVLKAWYRS